MPDWRVAIACLMLVTVAATRLQTEQRADPTDAAAIQRIREEASTRSQLTSTVGTLTDLYGPRLTGSPNLRAAAEYVIEKLKGWGLDDARTELWGPFGPGWSNDRFVALAVSPLSFPLIAYPKAWTPGTTGDVRAEAVVVGIERDGDFEKYRGTLRDKFVLTTPLRPIGDSRSETAEASAFVRRRMEFFVNEGVAALLEPSGRSGVVVAGDGRLATSFAAGMYPWPDPVPPQVVVANEHFNWMARALEKSVPVVLEMSIANTYYPAEPNSFNVIADIRGVEQPDEVVMIGAHIDSTHVGTGALDNAAGCAVVLEAMRILKATRLKMRRTVRLALWTGAEQGLLGSRAYVTQHFVTPSTPQALPAAHFTLSAYFNVDDGTGPFRGIYVQGNRSVVPVFEQWMVPFTSTGMTKVSLEGRVGKDHLPFDVAGLNGFHFMQEGADRDDQLRRSNFDLYDLLQPEALVENATIVASFAYAAANRAEPLPRKPASP
jgi:carboxypeptidase Q